MHQFTFTSTVYKSFLFSISLLIFVICRLFDDSHSDICQVILYHGFDLYFFDKWCWTDFYVPVGHLHVFFGKISIQVSQPFVNQVIFLYWVIEFIYIFWILIPCWSYHLQIFSPIQRVVLCLLKHKSKPQWTSSLHSLVWLWSKR